jgi:aspartokinase-like uncharacterized kinase
MSVISPASPKAFVERDLELQVVSQRDFKKLLSIWRGRRSSMSAMALSRK